MLKNLLKSKSEKLIEAAKSVDTDALTENLSSFASQVSDKATELAGQTRDWAAPQLEKAWRETVKVAAPKIEAASEAVRPRVDAAHEKLVEDYLPRVQRAMADAAAAAQSDAPLRTRAEKVASATTKALSEPTKKSRPILKTLLLSLGVAACSAVGYVLWRRSQPVEDPWAEEYWADLDAKTKEIDFAKEAAEAEEAAEEAVANMDLKDPKEALQDAAEKAGDKAEELADKAAEKVSEVKDAVEEKLDK
ncbi:hypothetical protein KRX54_01550 [Actinomycetaceae bacterium TAE3-ERU4]|nr:hypothetical protein [Actinomycetaceae bacterium TAE3-ERU4]